MPQAWSCAGSSLEYAECGTGASSLREQSRADNVCLWSFHSRLVFVGLRWVLRSLVYQTEAHAQVCFLNFRGLRPSPMACACGKIIQVWEERGFGRPGQSLGRCTEFPPHSSTSPAQYFNVESCFSFLCEVKPVKIGRQFFLQYFSIFI